MNLESNVYGVSSYAQNPALFASSAPGGSAGVASAIMPPMCAVAEQEAGLSCANLFRAVEKMFSQLISFMSNVLEKTGAPSNGTFSNGGPQIGSQHDATQGAKSTSDSISNAIDLISNLLDSSAVKNILNKFSGIVGKGIGLLSKLF